MRFNISVLIFIILILSVSCKSIKNKKQIREMADIPSDSINLDFQNGPPTIIYKTKNDYSKNVKITQ
jgi:hypothetical protein